MSQVAKLFSEGVDNQLITCCPFKPLSPVGTQTLCIMCWWNRRHRTHPSFAIFIFLTQSRGRLRWLWTSYITHHPLRWLWTSYITQHPLWWLWTLWNVLIIRCILIKTPPVMIPSFLGRLFQSSEPGIVSCNLPRTLADKLEIKSTDREQIITLLWARVEDNIIEHNSQRP